MPGQAQLAKACPVVVIIAQTQDMLGIRAMQVHHSCCGAKARSAWQPPFQAACRYTYQQHVYILGFGLNQLCLDLLEPVIVVLNAVVVLQPGISVTAAAASSEHLPPTGKWLTRC